jgi:hypothetical protein
MPQPKCKHKDGWLRCYLHETLGPVAECRCGMYRQLNKMGTSWYPLNRAENASGQLLWYRLNRGWNLDRAITPVLV